MTPMLIESGFFKRNFKPFLFYLKDRGHLVLLTALIYGLVNYTLQENIVVAPTPANIYSSMLLDLFKSFLLGVSGVFFTSVLMLLQAEYDGKFKGSFKSVILVAALDFKKTISSCLLSFVLFATVASIYSVSIAASLSDKAKSTPAPAVVPDNELIYFLFFNNSSIGAAMGLFLALVVFKPVRLLTFGPLMLLTQRYYGCSSQVAEVALVNGEKKNLWMKNLLTGLNLILFIFATLITPIIGTTLYILFVGTYYYLWLELFQGPGKTKKVEQKEHYQAPVPQKI